MGPDPFSQVARQIWFFLKEVTKEKLVMRIEQGNNMPRRRVYLIRGEHGDLARIEIKQNSQGLFCQLLGLYLENWPENARMKDLKINFETWLTNRNATSGWRLQL